MAKGEVIGTYLTPVEIVCLVIAVACCALRLYSRLGIQGRRSPSIDDLFVCIALICAFIVTSTHIASEHLWGLGRHEKELSEYNVSQIFLMQFISEWAFPVGNACVKLSILSFYLTFLSRETFPKLRKAVYWTMGFIVLWSLGLSIVITCACRPVKRWWLVNGEGECVSDYALGVIIFMQQAMNLISDLIVFLLPVKTLWVLQISKAKKIRMILLLGLGFVVCLVALIRIPVILALLLAEENDISCDTYPFFVTVAVELDLTIACACIPFCRPVAHRVAPAIKRFSHSFSVHSIKFKSTIASTISTRTQSRSAAQHSRVTSSHADNTRVDDRDVELGVVPESDDVKDNEVSRPDAAVLRRDDDVRRLQVQYAVAHGQRGVDGYSSTDSIDRTASSGTSGSQELVAAAAVDSANPSHPADIVYIVPVRNIRRMESLEMAIMESPTDASTVR